MASGGKEKQKEQELQGKTEQAITTAATPSPLEQRVVDQSTRFLDWDEGKGEFAGQPKDITKAPGIDAVLDNYGAAQALADQEMYGQGALAFADASNGAYGDQIKAQKDFNTYNARADAVNRALSGLRAQATGQVDTSIGRDINRNLNVAQLQQANLNSYYNRPRTPSALQTILGIGSTVAQAAGKGGLGWTPFG